MNIFDALGPWLKGRLKIRPHQLKGTPGVSDPEAAAEQINALLSQTIDAEALKHGATVNADSEQKQE